MAKIHWYAKSGYGFDTYEQADPVGTGAVQNGENLLFAYVDTQGTTEWTVTWTPLHPEDGPSQPTLAYPSGPVGPLEPFTGGSMDPDPAWERAARVGLNYGMTGYAVLTCTVNGTQAENSLFVAIMPPDQPGSYPAFAWGEFPVEPTVAWLDADPQSTPPTPILNVAKVGNSGECTLDPANTGPFDTQMFFHCGIDDYDAEVITWSVVWDGSGDPPASAPYNWPRATNYSVTFDPATPVYGTLRITATRTIPEQNDSVYDPETAQWTNISHPAVTTPVAGALVLTFEPPSAEFPFGRALWSQEGGVPAETPPFWTAFVYSFEVP